MSEGGNSQDTQALHTAVRNSDVGAVQDLLTSGKVQIDGLDKHQRTALHLAAWSGDTPMVQLLLRFHANPLLLARDGFSAMHFASQRTDGAEVCELLAKKSAKLLHLKVQKGKKTALHLAILKGNLEVVKKLLALGSDVTTKTGMGELLVPSIRPLRDFIISPLMHRFRPELS